MKNLPICTQAFREILEGIYYDVDKILYIKYSTKNKASYFYDPPGNMKNLCLSVNSKGPS